MRDIAVIILEGGDDGADAFLERALGANRKTADELPQYRHKYLKMSPSRPPYT